MTNVFVTLYFLFHIIMTHLRLKIQFVLLTTDLVTTSNRLIGLHVTTTKQWSVLMIYFEYPISRCMSKYLVTTTSFHAFITWKNWWPLKEGSTVLFRLFILPSKQSLLFLNCNADPSDSLLSSTKLGVSLRMCTFHFPFPEGSAVAAATVISPESRLTPSVSVLQFCDS